MAKFVFIGQDLFNQRAASSNPTHFYINRARRGELAKSLPLFDLAYALISGDDGDDYEKHRNAILKLESWVSGGLLVSDDQGRYTPQAVLALQTTLDQSGMWSEGVQRWCGVWGQQDGSDSKDDRELNSSALKSELIGCGTIRKANGDPIKWASVIENASIVKAAKVDGKLAGGQLVWRVEAFRRALADEGYTIDRASVISAAIPGMYGQLMKRK